MSGDQNESASLKTKKGPVQPSESRHISVTTEAKSKTSSLKTVFISELKRKWTEKQYKIMESLIESDDEEIARIYVPEGGKPDPEGFMYDVNQVDEESVLTIPQRRWAWRKYQSTFAPETKRRKIDLPDITESATRSIVEPSIKGLLKWDELKHEWFSQHDAYIISTHYYNSIQRRVFNYATDMPFKGIDGYSAREEDFWPFILESFETNAHGSKDSFHCPIDNIMRTVIKQVAPSTCSWNRNVKDESTTGDTRTDVLCHFSGYLLFRGEEKLAAAKQPLNEISAKMNWVFGKLPYVFAYTSAGTQMYFYALRPQPTDTTVLELKRIGSGNIGLPAGRLAVLSLSIKILQLCTCLADALLTSDIEAQKEYPKPHVLLAFSRNICEKTYTVEKHQLAFNSARVHVHLQNKGLSNQILQLSGPAWITKGTYDNDVRKTRSIILKFSPIGLDRRPISKPEAQKCANDLINQVEALHHTGIVHRDIRWPNVVNFSGEWSLIDFDHAYICEDMNNIPTCTELANNMHSPEMKQDFHTAAVDIWSLCALFLELNQASKWYNNAFLEKATNVKGGQIHAKSLSFDDLREVTKRKSSVVPYKHN